MSDKKKEPFSEKVKKFLFPEEEEDLFNQVADYNNYANYALDTTMNTQSLIAAMKDIPSMLQDPICSSACKLVMQTAFQSDEDEQLFQVRSDNGLLKNELDKFHEEMGANNFVLTNGYNILLWGQLPWKHMYNEDGILERVTPIPDFTSITPIVISGKTVGFINEEGNFVPSYEYTYSQMEYYRNLGGNTRSTYLTVGNNLAEENENFKNEFSYADSYLSSASKAWRSVNMIEDALMLHRLDQSNFFRIIAVNVGNQVYSKSAIQVLNYYRNLFKKVRRVNYDSNGMSSRGNSQEFDLIIPKTQNQGVEIQNVGGDVEIKAIRDLDNQYNKLFAALQIQPSMIGFSSDTPSSLGEGPTGSWDKRFARVCTAVAFSTYNALKNIDYLHLRSLGYDVSKDDWSYGYVSQTIMEDQDKAELLKTSIDNLKELSEVLGRSGAEVEYNKTYLIKATLGKALSTVGVDVEELLKVADEDNTKELIDTAFHREPGVNFKSKVLDEDMHVMVMAGMVDNKTGKEIVSAFSDGGKYTSIISEKTMPLTLSQIRSNFAVKRDNPVNLEDKVVCRSALKPVLEHLVQREGSQAIPFRFPVYVTEEMNLTVNDLENVGNHVVNSVTIDENGDYLFSNKNDLCVYLKSYMDDCLDVYCGQVQRWKGLYGTFSNMNE